MSNDPPVRWTLQEALDLVRFLEPHATSLGYHVGLTGGVLQKGHSTKDVDVIFYPRKTTDGGSPKAMIAKLQVLYPGLKAYLLSHYTREDTKLVYNCQFKDKRRMDVFFLQ